MKRYQDIFQRRKKKGEEAENNCRYIQRVVGEMETRLLLGRVGLLGTFTFY